MDPDQQVARLEKLIVRLGGFPDRDLIHQITECGRLGLRTGGQALAERMCAAIMDVLDDGENGATAAERRVPLFYALDSVVKNVGDVFQPLLSVRVRAAFGRAFAACAEKDKTRLHHVLRTWNEKSAAAARTPPSSFSRSDPTAGGGADRARRAGIFAEHLDDLNALVAPWHAALVARASAADAAAGPAAARGAPSQAQLAAQRVADREEARRRAARVGRRRRGGTADRARAGAARARRRARRRAAGAAAPRRRRRHAGRRVGRRARGREPHDARASGDGRARGRAPVVRALSRRRRAPAKRARSAAAAPAGDDDPLTAAARAKLDQLQRSLGEANPMTLEELKASQPEIHAKLLAEAAARDPRPSERPRLRRHAPPVSARRPRSARPRARAPGRRAVAAAAAPAPAAAPDGAPVGLGADVVAALEAVRRHGDDLIGGLARAAPRTAAARRRRRRRRASAGARRVAEQFRDELENAARRTTTPEPPGPGPARAFGGARRRPGAARRGRRRRRGARRRRRRRAAAVVPRPTPSMPGSTSSTEALAAAPNAGAVDALYAAWPEQCSADARRFMDAAARAPGWTSSSREPGARRARARATSRPWNPARAAWLADGTAEAAAAPDDALAPDAADGTDALAPDDADDGCARVVVPDDAAPTPCRVCGEAFDVAWDATAGEWVLAAAVSVPVDDGTDAVVHRACRDAVCGRGGTLEAAALVPVPSPPPGPTAP